jgi:hypothetical protein
MPFDDLRARALEVLEPRRQAYHSAVATAIDEVRALLDTQRAPTNGKGARMAAELGAFAAGRIDPERIAHLFAEGQSLDAEAVDQVQGALDTLSAVLAEGDAAYTLKVPAGGDLRKAVHGALARTGKVFGAGRAVENARSGARPADYGRGFGPDRWNRAERGIAPPLVVELEGADLRPAGLIDYLEGQQAIVLLVRSPAPPAALSRLIGPGILVAQGTDGNVLDGLARRDGPVLVAIVPETAAVFRYVPDVDGPGTLNIESIPDAAPRTLGTLSADRQNSDLELLRMLDTAGAGRVVAAATTSPGGETDPADKLAAWLLRQATIPAPGED